MAGVSAATAARLNSRRGGQQIERSRPDRGAPARSETSPSLYSCCAAPAVIKQRRLDFIVGFIGRGHRESSIFQRPLGNLMFAPCFYKCSHISYLHLLRPGGDGTDAAVF